MKFTKCDYVPIFTTINKLYQTLDAVAYSVDTGER